MSSVLVYPSTDPRALNSIISSGVKPCLDGETDDAPRCFKESAVIVMFCSVLPVCLLGTPSSPCISWLDGSFVTVGNVALVRGTLGGGGGDLRLAGIVGASDGLIDFGSPVIEIDEASTDGETRTIEWDEDVIWVDAPFAFVENELEGAWSRDGNPSEEAVTLTCCFSIVNFSSWRLSSDHGISFSMIVRELLALSLSLLFFKIKWSILIETTQVSVACNYEG